MKLQQQIQLHQRINEMEMQAQKREEAMQLVD